MNGISLINFISLESLKDGRLKQFSKAQLRLSYQNGLVFFLNKFNGEERKFQQTVFIEYFGER